MPTTHKIAAIDADGVLVDYRTHYAQAWFNAFGEHLTVHNPQSWYATQYWGAPHLQGKDLLQLQSKGFNAHHWRSMPAMPGAVAAVRALFNAGWSIVCVTALDPQFSADRLANLHHLGMPVSRVVATGSLHPPGISPKAAALAQLSPDLFVDDYAAYFLGLDHHRPMLKVLCDPGSFSDSPNPNILAQHPHLINQTAPSLQSFVDQLLA